MSAEQTRTPHLNTKTQHRVTCNIQADTEKNKDEQIRESTVGKKRNHVHSKQDYEHGDTQGGEKENRNMYWLYKH